MRTTWKVKKNKNAFEYVSMYARDSGKANTENKYDFPPPIDTVLYFGCCALIAHNGTDEWIDLSEDEWSQVYEELFGGFENLADTAKEDENEIDELDDVPDNLKTKSGYLKDDFIVDDDEMMNIHYHSLCATTTSSDGDDYQLRVSFLLVGTLGGV